MKTYFIIKYMEKNSYLEKRQEFFLTDIFEVKELKFKNKEEAKEYIIKNCKDIPSWYYKVVEVFNNDRIHLIT